MEYDNDRLRIRTTPAETFCWLLIAFLGAITDGIVFFHADVPGWVLTFVVSGISFPLYLLYSYVMGMPLFVRRTNWLTLALYGVAFLVIGAVILFLYYLLLKFDLRRVEVAYLHPATATLYRVGGWVALNLALATRAFNIRNSLEQDERLQAAQKESSLFQLRYLRAQLNPHFLFNTLNSIYSLSLQKSDRAPEMVVRLADIMRYLIYECDEAVISLDKEIEFIRNYIEIEKIRHQADIRLTVEGETSGVRIEPFLFISFIENGFKHALDNSFGEPYIYITIKIGGGQITLNVLNSMDADLEAQAKRISISGKGIAHSRSLLELLYPSSYDLDIIQTERDENRTSRVRLRNARERLERLYPDSHTLDVILNKSSFTVSLIVKTAPAC